MSLFSPRALQGLTVGLALLTGAVPLYAQAGLAPAAPPAKVDPQAKAVLDQMAAAYQALKTYSAKIATVSTGGSMTQKQTVTLSFQRPNRARAAIADATGPLTEVISDGTSLFLSSPRDKQYLKQAAPTEEAVSAALSQARGTLLPALAGSPQFILRFFGQPGMTVSLGTPETVAAVPTDTVTIALPNHNGTTVHFTLSVATGDHLLRQLTETAQFTRGGKSQTFTHTETVIAQTLNPALTAADFAFVPPPGSKKVEQAAEPPMYDARLKAGARPFPITAKDLSGRPLSLAQYQGKVVLLDFWATWCGPCVGEMPNVIAAYKKYHAQGFDVVGISLDQDKGSLTSFLKQNKMPWRQVFDGKGWGSQVPRKYGVAAIPFGLLVGRDGRIAAVEVRGDALPAAIRLALAKK